MNESKRYLIPRFYYFVTPAFVLLDYFGGLNIRVAVLDELPLYKNLYYGLCVLCGVIVFVRPWITPIVALCESTVNLLMTILSMFLPYLRNLEQVADLNGDWKAAETFGGEGLTNVLLAGIIAAIAFKESADAIAHACGFGVAESERAGRSEERDM